MIEVLVGPVGSWLMNVSVSELMNIHRAGRCSRSGGKFKRRGLHRVAAEPKSACAISGNGTGSSAGHPLFHSSTSRHPFHECSSVILIDRKFAGDYDYES